MTADTSTGKQKTGKKRAGLVLLIIVLAAAAVLLAFFIGVSGGSGDGKTVRFRVDKGAGTIAVAEKLKEKGIIEHPLVFRAEARLRGADRKWTYGTHKVTEGGAYRDLIDELTAPQTADIKVTVPEGLQVNQIADILEQKGICGKDAFLSECVNGDFDYRFLNGVDTHSRINGLEGYLFPDTYYFNKNTDPDDVINTMLRRFREKVYTDKIRSEAADMGYSVDDVIRLASVVESEAATESDRRTIAGVFLNRLNTPGYGKLQSCVTVEYAKRIKKSVLSLEDTKYDSPYNTYLYDGLPYGPICCPGMVSINAVLNHEDNDYYFFQSDQYGNLYFAKTYQEHAAIQKQVQSGWTNRVDQSVS